MGKQDPEAPRKKADDREHRTVLVSFALVALASVAPLLLLIGLDAVSIRNSGPLLVEAAMDLVFSVWLVVMPWSVWSSLMGAARLSGEVGVGQYVLFGALSLLFTAVWFFIGLTIFVNAHPGGQC